MKLFKNIGKRVVSCPACQKRLRVPVRPGKTLRVKCAKCQCEFDIGFKTPFSGLFTWYRGHSFRYNLKSFYLRFKALPFFPKLTLIIWVVLIYWILSSLLGGMLGVQKIEKKSPVKIERDLDQDQDQDSVELDVV